MKRFYLVHCYRLVARRVAHSRCSVNCCCLVAQLCPTLETPRSAAHQASLSFTISWSLFKLMSIGSIMPSNYFISCHPLLLLPSVFPRIRVSSNELALHIRWPSIGASASASVLPMNIQGWYPLGLTGLISFLYKGLSRVFSSTIVQKHQFFGLSLLYGPGLSEYVLINEHEWMNEHQVSNTSLSDKRRNQDGGIEGRVLIFSCKNTQITTSCWTTIDRRMLDPTDRSYSTSKGKGQAPIRQ